MSEAAAGHGTAEHAVHTPKDYVKIWGILLVLLAVSITGPMLGIKVVTLITAFGIAIVKAYMVVKHFMHINVEPKFVAMMVLTMVVLMLLFFGAVSPDVMEHQGANWTNTAAKEEIARREASDKAAHEHGEGEHAAEGAAAGHE